MAKTADVIVQMFKAGTDKRHDIDTDAIVARIKNMDASLKLAIEALQRISESMTLTAAQMEAFRALVELGVVQDDEQ